MSWASGRVQLATGSIQTEHLTLVPFTLDLLEAAMRDPQEVGRRLGVRIADGWPNPDEQEMLPIIANAYRREPETADWQRLILHRADHTLIGGVGFKGLPDVDGNVEIGYGISPRYRRRGFASEAAQAMIAWALLHEWPVQTVRAECEIGNLGSIRVLEKVGMKRVARDGALMKWELRRAP